MTVLSINDVTFSYKGNSKKVLNHINASFDGGKIYAVVGESGSGKTTLLITYCRAYQLLKWHNQV